MDGNREQRVAETVVELADTLVSDYDALAFMSMLAERSADLLDVSDAGVILVDGLGGLSVAAASSEDGRLLETFAVAINAGPWVECVRDGQAVSCPDIAADDRWPHFATGAAAAGFRAVHALPMRLRDESVGALTLLDRAPRPLSETDRRLGQALADATTIGLLHERAIRQAETASEQLQRALKSRIVIEQAKGDLAATRDLTPEAAFAVLRRVARDRGLRLTELCRDVIDGLLLPDV